MENKKGAIRAPFSLNERKKNYFTISFLVWMLSPAISCTMYIPDSILLN